MAEKTGIEWCHHTWSPWRGCSKVSPGCKLCYAEARSRRFKTPAATGTWGPDGIRAINKNWDNPIRWNRAANKAGLAPRVFPSLCDPFEDRPDLVDTRVRFLELIFATPDLTWLLLTKRIEWFRTSLLGAMIRIKERHGKRTSLYWDVAGWLHGASVPANVWLGVSTENQEYADERIPVLLETPAAVRWVSYEPALGPIDFRSWLVPSYTVEDVADGDGRRTPALDWIVVGGESNQGGQEARPFDVEWARSTVAAGKAAGVPIFVKQLGSLAYDSTVRISIAGPGSHAVECDLRDRKGGDWDEWPHDLRVREFPAAAA